MKRALLSALTMVAFVTCVGGAPIDLPTDAPSGEGDVRPLDLLSDSPLWKVLLDATHRNRQMFDREFSSIMDYLHLDNFNISSFPEDCQNTSINMEGCLKRLVRGLLVFQVLLKHVEREYPKSEILPKLKYFCRLLTSAAGQKMRNSDIIQTLSQSDEDSLLKEVGHPDTFYRKMFAHNILRKLHEFLRETKFQIKKRERRPGFTSS
ncbi:unnamed protein product [Knipowitschia caucasica]|uniref:Interleukin-6 n=1 Tax=Knipowitschia caucasica TaxID=637954 RepID=A0AAV2K6L4_KNICA